MQNDELIKQKFTNDNIEIFKLNFKIYLGNEINKNGFVINLDDIYKYIGFSTKGNAKKLLEKEFTINTDYITYQALLIQMDKQDINNCNNPTIGGSINKLFY